MSIDKIPRSSPDAQPNPLTPKHPIKKNGEREQAIQHVASQRFSQSSAQANVEANVVTSHPITHVSQKIQSKSWFFKVLEWIGLFFSNTQKAPNKTFGGGPGPGGDSLAKDLLLSRQQAMAKPQLPSLTRERKEQYLLEQLFEKSGLSKIILPESCTSTHLYELVKRNCQSLGSDELYKNFLKSEQQLNKSQDEVERMITRTLITNLIMGDPGLADELQEILKAWHEGNADESLHLVRNQLFPSST